MLKQDIWHRPMRHVHGYTGSHWTPPLGNYFLRIASVAARATANKTKMQNVSTLLTISMAIAMRQYYTSRIDRWGEFVAFIKATKHRHWVSTCSNRHQSDMPTPISGVYFIVKLLNNKSSSCPNYNRGVTHQTDEKHLNICQNTLLG